MPRVREMYLTLLTYNIFDALANIHMMCRIQDTLGLIQISFIHPSPIKFSSSIGARKDRIIIASLNIFFDSEIFGV